MTRPRYNLASGFDLYELVFVKDWNKPGILSMGIKAEHFTKFQGIFKTLKDHTCSNYLTKTYARLS